MDVCATIRVQDYVVVTEPEVLPHIRSLVQRALIASADEDKETGDLDIDTSAQREAEQASMFELEVKEGRVYVTLPSGKQVSLNLEDALQFLVAAGLAQIRIADPGMLIKALVAMARASEEEGTQDKYVRALSDVYYDIYIRGDD